MRTRGSSFIQIYINVNACAQHRSQLTGWASNYSAANKCQASTVTAGAALALTAGPGSFTFSSRSHPATVGGRRCWFFSNKLVHCRCEFWLYFTAVESITLNATKDRMGPGNRRKRGVQKRQEKHRKERWERHRKENKYKSHQEKTCDCRATLTLLVSLRNTQPRIRHSSSTEVLPPDRAPSLGTYFMNSLKPPPSSSGYLSGKLYVQNSEFMEQS